MEIDAVETTWEQYMGLDMTNSLNTPSFSCVPISPTPTSLAYIACDAPQVLAAL